MKENLILMPLTVLGILALISVSGLTAAGELGEMHIGGNPENAVYYDENGHSLCYVSNLTSIGEQGNIFNLQGAAMWVNTTNFLGQPTMYYFMFYDDTATQGLLFQDVGQTNNNGKGGLSISSSLGIIALIIGLMALAIVAGLSILGSGISETSVSALWLGTGLIALWGIFSAIALNLIILIELGPIFYIVLTFCYCVGIILAVKG